MRGSAAPTIVKPLKEAPERIQKGVELLRVMDAAQLEEDKKAADAEKVDFAELTTETVRVNDICIPIPSALADHVLKEHLKLPDPEKFKIKGEYLAALWQYHCTVWWILDHQYDKDDNDRHVIRKFISKPEWRPPDSELEEYMAQLDFGPRLSDFYAAYNTALEFNGTEEGRTKLDAARSTGQAQKIHVVRPYRSQSET
jgi:hypothetical protein